MWYLPRNTVGYCDYIIAVDTVRINYDQSSALGVWQPYNRCLMSRADRLRALLDLAYDASSYLRRSPDRVVRTSAALLLAASLAACSGGEDQDLLAPSGGKSGALEEVTTASPLTQEVRSGLPDQPGRYPIVHDSIVRDQRGVYLFSWRRSDDPPETRHEARASLIRLLQADEDSLEMPQQGDPILRLKRDTPIKVVESSLDQRRDSYPSYMPWLPFFLMTAARPGPVYYDPPSTVQRGGTIQGARESTTPRPPAERSIGVKGAVSGRAGGAGSGSAVTNRVGGSTDGSGTSAPKSGSFSSGSGGSSSAGSSGG